MLQIKFCLIKPLFVQSAIGYFATRLQILFRLVFSLVFILLGLNGLVQLTAQENTEQEVQILSDKIYLYNYFNVLFKTPFGLEENVHISALDLQQNRVLRTKKLDYSRYQAEDNQIQRAFILGFYTVSPGLHQLPRFRFQSSTSGQSWQSPSIPFASFRVDEGSLPLPVDLELNPLPKRVYLSQNIVLNVWAQRLETIDQSFLQQLPEFESFLVQRSPVKPEVERQEILGKNVYRVPLGTWLLNPIEEGLLNIPAIQASVMGLKRQTLARQLEVLPLPPNPYQKSTRGQKESVQKEIAIGQFTLSFRLLPPEPYPDKRYQAAKLQDSSRQAKDRQEFTQEFAQGFAQDEMLHIVLRITGNGNIHLFSFPEVRVPSSLVMLQSDETESLALDFAKAELSGWREKELIYKAKSSGKYRVGIDSFYFFDPEQGRWQQTESQELTLQVVNRAKQSYYINLEDLYFSDLRVFFFNIMFWLQKYAFYICLVIFLFTSIYFLRSRLPLPSSQEANQNYTHQPSALRQKVRRNQYRKMLFVALALVLIWLSISVTHDRTHQKETQEYYLGLLREQVAQQGNLDWDKIKGQLPKLWYFPGNLPNISLLLYQNGLPLQALELAYLSYFQLPLHPISRRLVSSLRIQQELGPRLPDFFFWPLQLRHIWKFLASSLFVIASIYCIYPKRQQDPHQDPKGHEHSYRNYSIVAVLLLLSLSIPWRFALAVNTRVGLSLEPIPYSETLSELTERSSNRLNAGELVKIKGRANDTNVLVIGEKQDQGWLNEQDLFLLPKY